MTTAIDDLAEGRRAPLREQTDRTVRLPRDVPADQAGPGLVGAAPGAAR